MILQRVREDIALTVVRLDRDAVRQRSAYEAAFCLTFGSKGVGISSAVIGKVRVSNSAGCCRIRGIGDRPCGRRTDDAGRPVSDLTASRHGHSVLNLAAAGCGEARGAAGLGGGESYPGKCCREIVLNAFPRREML
jgi:hypothetical protein